eukprot:11217-Chlamydomonas_euryale.AAC.1
MAQGVWEGGGGREHADPFPLALIHLQEAPCMCGEGPRWQDVPLLGRDVLMAFSNAEVGGRGMLLRVPLQQAPHGRACKHCAQTALDTST